ncbi:MAG: hypothetical protein LBM71_02595 [Elusimicrobiota bacterium]|jgi:hypothetical protein|nr:hypothetical protein [Elusimicrobiota bacterium]
MKYWYLKGGDIYGPLEAAEIIKDEEFAPYTLVCPEPYSADENYWKEALEYADDFGLNAEQEPKPQVNTQVNISGQNSPAPIPLEEVASKLSEVSPEDTIHTRSPITASLEDNLLADIPAKAVLGPEPKNPTADNLQKPSLVARIEEESIKDKITADKPKRAPRIFASSDRNIVPDAFDATLHQNWQNRHKEAAIKKSIETETAEEKEIREIFEDKKPLSGQVIVKEEDTFPFPPEQLPRQKSEPKEQPEDGIRLSDENLKLLETFTTKEQGGQLNETPALKKVQRPVATEQTVAKDETIDHSAKVNPNAKAIGLTPLENIRYGGGISPTTDGQIINSSSNNIKANPKSKNHLIMYLVFFMFLVVAAALFITFTKNDDGQEDYQNNLQNIEDTISMPNTDTQEVLGQPYQPKPVPQGIDEGIASPAAKAQNTMRPLLGQNTLATGSKENEAIAKIRAEEIVKNYQLSANRGTIGQYFAQLYNNSYQTRWTVTPLVNNLYGVDFAASKVRAEPIVYSFRVDVKEGKITAPLNNLTFALLSNSTSTRSF